MAAQDAHDWWADVQQDRETLQPARRRAVAVWADDVDFDLAPDRVRARRAAAAGAPADVPTRGRRFVRAADAPPAAVNDPEARTDELAVTPRRIVLETADGPEVLVEAGDVDDARGASDAARPRRRPADTAPPRGAGGVVQIKGRPEERRAAVSWDTPRRSSRSAAERVAHRPDRVMLWVVLIGFLLILLAFATGSSEAAAAI